MYTQRNNERRCFRGKTSFPLVTDGGHEVEKDRRSIPDRRLGNIHQELIDVLHHGFYCHAPEATSISDPS